MDHVLDDGLYAEQDLLEEESIDRGVARYRRLSEQATARGDGASLKPAERLLLHWFKVFRYAISCKKAAVKAGKAGKGSEIYGPHLLQIDSDKAAVLAMHEAVGMCLAEPAGVTALKVVLAIGRAVQAELNYKAICQAGDEAYDAMMKTDRKQLKPPKINKTAKTFGLGYRWPIHIQTHVGAILLDILLKYATIGAHDEPMDPAFVHWKQRKNNKTPYYLRLTHSALNLIEDGHAIRRYQRPKFQPMVVPPMPWRDGQPGGYLRLPVELYKRAIRAEHVDAENETVREGVNALNSTPWRVNETSLAVVEELWATGGNIAGIPPADDTPRPPLPKDFETSVKAKHQWKVQAAKVYSKNVQQRSIRVDFLYKLDVARRFFKYEKIYFPHQLDYRIRQYPVPLHLNHQGDDVCRGLLTFTERRKVTDEGLWWLKVHLANMWGLDKAAFDQRIAWVDDSTKQIIGWAKDPLENTGWLETDNEKPFQVLAAASALRETLDTGYCQLPVQVDGTNNALQHFSAMLRDPETAAMVNLLPSDSPEDVYIKVALKTAQLVAKGADAGSEIAAKMDGWVTRGVVKQTVMTDYYGVTIIGARRQTYEQLKKAGFSEDDLYRASQYLSKKSLQANALICPGPHKAMNWLRDCAWAITNTSVPVRWRSPLDTEIEQPHRNSSTKDVDTVLQRLTVRNRIDAPVSKSKQTKAFPPNFIHNYDGCHMLCTAIDCDGAGINIAGVHDGYFAHPNDMGKVIPKLLDQFVLLHETPALENLHQQFLERYPDIEFPTPPPIGTLDINQIRTSRYAFS